jgi:thiol:disulfide interchange protein DsbD
MRRCAGLFALVFLMVALASASVSRSAAADDDPFADSNAAAVPKAAKAAASRAPDDDPFANNNAAAATPKRSEAPAPGVPDKTLERLSFEASVEPETVRPGQTVRLTIHGTPKPGFHTYPITQYADDPLQSPSGLSQLVFAASKDLRALPATLKESEPEFVVDKAGGVLLEYPGPFSWSMDVLVMPDTPPGDHRLDVAVKFAVCNDVNCINGVRNLSVPVRVAGEPVALTAALEKRLNEPAPAPRMVAVPAALRGAGPVQDKAPAANNTTASVAATVEVGLLQKLALAAVAGFVMLLTPCVFPMIPITVSFFLKQGEKEHHNPLALAVVYSGTIIVVLTAAVLVLGSSIVRWANDPWLNLGMGVIMFVFALSLFGMFELELPHFLTRFTSAREGQGGYVGAFFMALTFTINSFTCTGPFLGPLLSGVKGLRLGFWEIAASAVTYSAAFAAPFFVLALFPRLLKTLPRSGGWLNVTKVVMGFVEVALGLKFLSITDAAFFPGNPRFFNYETVLCTWIALAVGCGLYLLGLFRLPHDDPPAEGISVPRLLLATFFLGVAVYMTPLLQRRAPLGAVGEFLVAILPQDSALGAAGGNGSPAAAAARPEAGELDYSSDFEAAWAQAKREHKLLFIDFTGVNCANCRLNEKRVFPRPDVRAEISKFVRVKLYTDLIPDPRLTTNESQQQAERNYRWQGATFGDTSLPLYAVLDPASADKPVTEAGKLGGTIKGQASGTITDVPEFVAVLRNAQGRNAQGKQVARSE